MRGINERFLTDMKDGCLQFFFEQCKQSDSIWLGIRKDYVNLYYRGGNALKISQQGGGYSFDFDARYCLHQGGEKRLSLFNGVPKNDIEEWKRVFPIILEEMDAWFLEHPKAEREFQHHLLSYNHKDFCVADIEYSGWTKEKKLFRLDMLAAYSNKIIIIENKYGQGALGGAAGLKKHYDDIAAILQHDASREELTGSVLNILKNKQALGMINVDFDFSGKIEFLFLMAEYNPRSKSIANEITKICRTVPAKILFMNKEERVIPYATAKDLWEYGI